MSLVDSLLLDPYPFDIWIAWRSDSVGGTGTLNDPHDGSTTKFVGTTTVTCSTRQRPEAAVDSENQDLRVLGLKGIQHSRAGEPGVDSESEQFAAGYFGRIWQVRSLVVENNVIELGRHAFDSPSLVAAYAVGLRLYGTRFGPESSRQYSLVRLVARGNVIRNMDEIGDRGQNSKAIEMGGCECALLEHNIIDLPSARPLEHNTCGEDLHTFNNLTPAGTLVESLLQGSNEKAAEVTVKVRADLEDAIVLSFLKSPQD